MGATMRTRSASIAMARSSASEAMRETFTPAAGRNSNIVTTGPGRICVTCPWMPKEASFWRSFSAVAVRPSRSSGTDSLGVPVRMVMGGGTKALWPGAIVNAPLSAGSGGFEGCCRTGGRGSTMVGGGSGERASL
jgi:hypothetical protein